MLTILIVDDSDTMRIQLKKDLAGRGYQVLEAANGAEGLKILKENKAIDVAICDVNMPIMDGLTMCEKLTEAGKPLNLSIFMLTTESTADSKERGKKAGVRAWITKPYQADKLISAIEKVTQAKPN